VSKAIYIAGPMRGVADYRNNFDAAEAFLSWKGWAVLNPAMLPEGLKSDAYMPICLAMLNAADAICLLKGSSASQGAMIEQRFADYQGKPVYMGVENVPEVAEHDP